MFRRLLGKKGRRYPIKRDERGMSARQRCFELFEENVTSKEIAEVVGVPVATVNKYHQQWRKHPNLEDQVAYLRQLLKKDCPEREQTIELVATAYHITKEEVEAMVSQPNGAKRIITGKFYFPRNREDDYKRFVAFKLALLISDHLINDGGNFEDVFYSLRELLKRNKAMREQEDLDIKHYNQTVALTRVILDAGMKNERERGAQPDRLSPEEVREFLRLGASARARRAEKKYWKMIGELTGEGLTIEQAREKMYQDLLQRGETEAAAALKKYQDIVHPLKPKGESAPPSTTGGDHKDQWAKD